MTTMRCLTTLYLYGRPHRLTTPFCALPKGQCAVAYIQALSNMVQLRELSTGGRAKDRVLQQLSMHLPRALTKMSFAPVQLHQAQT
jgi:hypothetical protein